MVFQNLFPRSKLSAASRRAGEQTVIFFNMIKTKIKEKAMTKVISMINLKGGVGKTQLVVAMGEFLASIKNKKVLIIDLDPQTNATVMLIGEKKWKSQNKKGYTLYQLFKDKIDRTKKFEIRKTIINRISNISSGLNNLDLFPSSLDLISIQDRIPSIGQDQFGIISPSTILQNVMQPIIDEEKYDFILIDCPPNLGMITLNGLMISDYYLIPTKADYISTYGIPQIIERINEFNDASQKNVTPLGIVITMYSGHHKRLHDEVIDFIENHSSYPDVYEDYIPFRIRIAETSYFDGSTTYTLKQKYGDSYDVIEGLIDTILTEV